ATDGSDESDENENEISPAPDFTLTDQYGVKHTLSDYRGKTVFLNFWATWCPPCRAEMPDIQAIYEETLKQKDPDLVILGVAFPGYGKETDEEGIRDFLEENGYTYPVLMDTDASLMLPYYINAYPTTYMIDREGNVYGYVPGSMTRDVMEDVIRQTQND
ncbi:MAG: TlpA family protein disulfide reductase, partial [Lachnospiraceae bacterium]|nr:TlpA family protein disulfide reductase [Lachnospiraceae bacterium]